MVESGANINIANTDDYELNSDKELKSKKRKIAKKKESKETSSENRRNAQASRTLKACDLCRKQKTRCFRSPENATSCLRCTFLNKVCSFEINPGFSVALQSSTSSVSQNDSNETNTKLDLIYRGINEILSQLKNGNSNNEILNNDAKLLLEAASSMKKVSVPGTPSLPYLDNLYQGKSTIPGIYTNFGSSALPSAQQDQEFGTVKEYAGDCNQWLFQSPINSLKAAPFSIINNQLKGDYIPQPIANLLHLSTVAEVQRKNAFYDVKEDIISLGILNKAETIDLMNNFRRNYGRWVSFPSNLSTDVLIERIRYKSSLLLTTCCCLSLRYSLNGVGTGSIDNIKRTKLVYRALMRKLVSDLDKSLIKYASFQRANDNSGDIEFLQALVILSIYSLSLSSIFSSVINDPLSTEDDSSLDLKDINLDPWFLSGIGLTTFITKSTFGTLLNANNKQRNNSTGSILGDQRSPFTILYDELDSNEYQTLTILRLYNHLTLVHLNNCVFSGRMCIVDEIRLNYCSNTLSLSSATNFDGRMVSEIGIFLIAYSYNQVNLNTGASISLKECEAGFKSVKEEIKQWYEQWEYLFNQPALQFVELCYNFCYLLVYYSFNYQKYLLVDKAYDATINSDNPTLSQLYDENNIRFIITHCNKESLIKMVEHSYHIVKFINVIESDSYFAYLSDQLHFCFYFSGLCLIKLLEYLRLTNQLKLLNEINTEDIPITESNLSLAIKDIKNLIEKYGRVGKDNKDDIITKYKNGLEDCLKTSFRSDQS